MLWLPTEPAPPLPIFLFKAPFSHDHVTYYAICTIFSLDQLTRMESNVNTCVDHVITKVLVLRVKITVIVIVNDDGKALALSVNVMDTVKNVTETVREVVLIIGTAMTILMWLVIGKDIVNVTVIGRVIVRDHATSKGLVIVKDHVTVVENVTRIVGVMWTAKDTVTKIDIVIAIKTERVMKQVVRITMHTVTLIKRRVKLDSLRYQNNRLVAVL